MECDKVTALLRVSEDHRVHTCWLRPKWQEASSHVKVMESIWAKGTAQEKAQRWPTGLTCGGTEKV